MIVNPVGALPLSAYRDAVHLDQPFRLPGAPVPTDGLEPQARTALRLLSGDPAAVRLGVRPEHAERLDAHRVRWLLRAVLTVRDPGALPEETAAAVDALLDGERRARPSVDPHGLPEAAPRLSSWRGDITELAADAIVNAANSALLGCFRPDHPCVDNAIHSAAGPRLRDDCHTIAVAQGTPEPTGTAKITRGYHLPARHVVHTVGPVVDGPVRPDHERALAAAYRSCLDLAAEVESIRTIAFCGVSTGVFGYPKAPAARVALTTTTRWLHEHPDRFDRVVFVAFAADDHDAYRHAFAARSTTS
ncbi:protein-ADP-ribose hydrolase [Umezawaea endophytica]|uniref:Protein-ADP-ribose hydrolase n=1 Tax=Umezawaea endophytica TaxID=1654476 RepID=A0A9X2VMQ8_9PSEU|nr:protein-ADP-ribose hydrolase [Umezawaea endophytica]MCS7479375.1 protein-ADP-ribose hydrolase [Umezawaea endophytica]